MEEKIQNHLKTVGGFVGDSHFYDYGLPELHMTLSVPQLQFSAVMAWLVWIWTRAPIWKPPFPPLSIVSVTRKSTEDILSLLWWNSVSRLPIVTLPLLRLKSLAFSVKSTSANAQDVSEEYVDVQARIKTMVRRVAFL
mgnify:CR=1 FL=1